MAQRTSKKKPLTQYEQVQKILNDAQGKHIPSYDGYRDFWNRPLDEFKEVVIVGQRMIAAPQAQDLPSGTEATPDDGCSSCGSTNGVHLPNCWPTTSSGGSKRQSGQKRSDRSGLIIGLRGEYPFDGTIFPRLLWNASDEVSASDIQVIAKWIDSGCPLDDPIPTDAIDSIDDLGPQRSTTIQVREQDHVAFTNGDKAHDASAHHSSIHADANQNVRQRKSVSSMTSDEFNTLRQAVWCMNQYNDYYQDERSWNFWARIHANSCQHGWEQFLPWHRLYLYFFEQQLRDYDNTIVLPYWDWTNYSKANRNTDNIATLDQGIIPQAYHCWIDDKGIAKLKELPGTDGNSLFSKDEITALEEIQYDPTAPPAKQHTYNSGLRFLAAANIDYTLEPFTNNIGNADYRYGDKVKAIYDVLWETNPLWHRRRWPGSVGSAGHYPTTEDIDAILATQGFALFGGGPGDDHHFGRLEEIHNGMHNFAGGANPYWKAQYNQGNSQSDDNPHYGDMTDNRVTAYDPIFWAHHCNVDRLWYKWQKQNPNVTPEDLDGVLAPWSLTVADSLSTTKLGYEYVKDVKHVPTLSDVAYTRVKTTSLGVQPNVLSTFSAAEVRLHRVQKARYNGIIRVFLNLPDADVNTPITDNVHYAGQVTTFGGTCVGGPNHCDVPFPRRQRFDHRQLHHNEPRNFRLDVTKTVEQLRDEQDATDISVHLVVTDLDGTPADGALYFDGLSLNFMD
ncbi:MAG: tyrosinase family protein [Chloroflexota bacterium]